MADLEHGSPAWDISVMLTRHRTTSVGGPICARVMELRRTTREHGDYTPAERVKRALNFACTCGAGNSETESSSIRRSQSGPVAAATAN